MSDETDGGDGNSYRGGVRVDNSSENDSGAGSRSELGYAVDPQDNDYPSGPAAGTPGVGKPGENALGGYGLAPGFSGSAPQAIPPAAPMAAA